MPTLFQLVNRMYNDPSFELSMGDVCCMITKWLVCKIVSTFILVGVLTFICWLIMQPKNNKFHVTEATLPRFDYYAANTTLHYNLALNVSIRNPNRRLGFYYDKIEAFALYHDVRFGDRTLEPFFQHHKNTSFLNPVLEGQRVTPPLGADQASEFEKEKGSGVYSIDLRLVMTVRCKFLSIKSAKVKFKVRCKLHVPLLKSRNATTTATTSPDNAAFQPTKCSLKFRQK